MFIDRYKIIKSLGKGGMGEVFLAYDPVCKRHVALKKIKDTLIGKQMITRRFLSEAKIAASLTHPGIIPIYSISIDKKNIFYTMAYIEGLSLKELLKKKQTEEGDAPGFGSFSSNAFLLRTFLNVCEAISYTHSKGIVHRDLKPDNILLGKFGEVQIIDWGIAAFINQPPSEEALPAGTPQKEGYTKPGKLAGTLAYLAPERALGEPHSVLSDIYSLGVILYLILTLQLPFIRPTVSAFKKNILKELLIDPELKAPHRDISAKLSVIAKKCLETDKNKRYQTLCELIEDLKSYIDGKPDWIKVAFLKPQESNDWEFQENVLLAKQAAISSESENAEWSGIMISKNGYPGNIKIEANIKLDAKSSGIGLLLFVPSVKNRPNIEEGYCLWLEQNTAGLYRSNILIKSLPALALGTEQHKLTALKQGNIFKFYLDDSFICSHICYLPVLGSHIGLLHKDYDFEIDALSVFSASHNVMVNCLAVPDAFLEKQDFKTALFEYRRIAICFPDRQEGQSALFRAGMALIEAAKNNRMKKEQYLAEALDEFAKLHMPPSGPLEYIGKALVYAETGECEEEAKCMELAIRKYPKHKLLYALHEHLIFRALQSAKTCRETAYRLLLIALQNIEGILRHPEIRLLLISLQNNWEELYFLKAPQEIESEKFKMYLTISLAYRLGKKRALFELLGTASKEDAGDILFALLELGFTDTQGVDIEDPLLKLAFTAQKSQIDSHLKNCFKLLPETLDGNAERCLLFLLRFALEHGRKFTLQGKLIKQLSLPGQIFADNLLAWQSILGKDLKMAEQIIFNYSKDQLSSESHPMHFTYGCLLYAAKEKKKAKLHFNAVMEKAHPPSNSLGAYFLTHKKHCLKKLFSWEKRELQRQLMLFYKLSKHTDKEELYYRGLYRL